MSEKPLTKKELAEYLSVSRSTIERLINSKKFKYFRVGKQIRIPRSEVRRYEQAHLEGGEKTGNRTRNRSRFVYS